MRLWLMVLLILMFGACARAEMLPPRVMRAVSGHAPKIDGIFESEWLRGAVADSFVQRQPSQGQPPSLPTRAYILYDRNAIYAAFLCLDSSPDSIHARLQRRDNDAQSDAVQLILDSFHDLRNGYFFGVTACGVQVDGTISSETYIDLAWDGIWQSAVGKTDSGWVAEMRIPFSSIRHGGSATNSWGINLNRYIERRGEDAFWVPVSPERGFHVSEMGVIEGLDSIASARHIEILPHAVGRWDARGWHPSAEGVPAGAGKWTSKNKWTNLGGHIKIVPSGSWTMDLAYQPDFAQVDVDDEVINLSNYPVFLYEKRPFFLESKDLYDNAPITLFYSRRITDPDYGGRLSAQAGDFRWTAVGAKNRDQNDRLQNTGAGRAVWNIGRLSNIGFSGTYIDGTSLYDPSQFHAAAASIDTRIRWGKRNYVSVVGSAVDRSGPQSQPVATIESIFYDTGPFNILLGNSYRGIDYNINDLGWDSYSNDFRQHIELTKQWYPRRSMFYLIGFSNQNERRAFADGSHVEGSGNLDVYATTRSYWTAHLGSQWGSAYYRDYYSSEWPHKYRDNFYQYGFNTEYHPTWRRWASLQSDPRQKIEGTLSASYETYRAGYQVSFAPEVQVKPRPNLDFSTGLDWEKVWGVPEVQLIPLGFTEPDLRVWRLKAHYSPSIDITLRGTVQWLEYEKRAYTNLMLAWNWHPGSWFYVVFDESGRRTNPLMMRRPGDRTLRLKWTYYFTVP